MVGSRPISRSTRSRSYSQSEIPRTTSHFGHVHTFGALAAGARSIRSAHRVMSWSQCGQVAISTFYGPLQKVRRLVRRGLGNQCIVVEVVIDVVGVFLEVKEFVAKHFSSPKVAETFR